MITTNALICALYVVLTLLTGNWAYFGGTLNIRLGELLYLFVFFNPSYTLGVTLGCFISNIISLYGWPDMVLGTGATLLACLSIVLISKTIKNLFLASLMPVIFNATIVPIVIYLYDMTVPLHSFYWTSFMWVGLGELIVSVCLAYPLFMILTKKYGGFYKLISATTALDYKW